MSCEKSAKQVVGTSEDGGASKCDVLSAYGSGKPVVSFDYDGTLSQTSVQRYARRLEKEGIEVRVVTRREEKIEFPYYNDDLRVDAKFVGASDVHYTEGKQKSDWFNEHEGGLIPTPVFHLDDDPHELETSDESNVIFVDVTDPNWRTRCDEILAQFKESN